MTPEDEASAYRPPTGPTAGGDHLRPINLPERRPDPIDDRARYIADREAEIPHAERWADRWCVVLGKSERSVGHLEHAAYWNRLFHFAMTCLTTGPRELPRHLPADLFTDPPLSYGGE